MKLAVPTKEDKGLDDSVSDVFGRAETFTILEITNSPIVNVEVIRNPAVSYKHGSGPIVAKMLTDMKVKAVAAKEFGLGASTLLEQNKKLKIKAKIPVKEAVQNIIKELKEQA